MRQFDIQKHSAETGYLVGEHSDTRDPLIKGIRSLMLRAPLPDKRSIERYLKMFPSNKPYISGFMESQFFRNHPHKSQPMQTEMSVDSVVELWHWGGDELMTKIVPFGHSLGLDFKDKKELLLSSWRMDKPYDVADILFLVDNPKDRFINNINVNDFGNILSSQTWRYNMYKTMRSYIAKDLFVKFVFSMDNSENYLVWATVAATIGRVHPEINPVSWVNIYRLWGLDPAEVLKCIEDGFPLESVRVSIQNKIDLDIIDSIFFN